MNKNFDNRAYESPEMFLTEMTTEGILCLSGDSVKNNIDDLDYFEWEY